MDTTHLTEPERARGGLASGVPLPGGGLAVSEPPGIGAMVEELIARVLGQAHEAAEALNAPDEARVILRVAESFADALAAANPAFDRVRFIRAATTDGS